MDFLTTAERSERMARIRGRGTKPERRMAALLRTAGIRYRCHVASLPGRPDFLLLASKVVVFVDGAFWHGRNLDKWRRKLKPFWKKKITGNLMRDRRNRARLRKMGYCVLRFWEEDVHQRSAVCIRRIQRALSRPR
jgi:DNA mismatch endonuclease (patch repair protein)